MRSKNGPGVGDTEAANLLGEVYSPDGGLILGVWGVRNNVGLPGVNCQSYPPRQLTYALKKAAKQNGSGA